MAPDRTFSPHETRQQRLWSELNFIAPDVFTEPTKLLVCSEANEGRRWILPSMFSYSSDTGDMDSGVTILDVTIVAPMMVAQITKYITVARLAVSGSLDVTHQQKLLDITNNVFVPPTCASGVSLGDKTGTDSSAERTAALIDALLRGSSKLFVLDLLLPLLRMETHAVLMVCHGSDLLISIEDYCVLKEFPVIKVSAKDSTGDRLEVQYYQQQQRSFTIFLLLVADCMYVDIPAVESVIYCDVSLNPSENEKTQRILRNIRHCNRICLYRLRTAGCNEESGLLNQSIPNEIIASTDTFPEVGMSAFLPLGGGEKGNEAEAHKSKHYSKKKARVIASMWGTSSPSPFGVNIKSKNRIVRIKGYEDDTVKRYQSMDNDMLSTQQDAYTPSTQPKHWKNLRFCCLCGCFDLSAVKKTVETKYHNHRLVNCKLCPRVFHRACFEDSSLPQKELVLEDGVCPQHLCVCGANAGVMCPCVDCLTVYCENCLPESDVVSMGRRTESTKSCGYYSRLYHYIRCDYCAQVKYAEDMTDAECTAAGLYYVDRVAKKGKNGDSGNAVTVSATKADNITILPSQTTPSFNTELPVSRKRKFQDIEDVEIEETALEAEEIDEPSDIEIDGTLSLVVRLLVDGIQLCPVKKMSIETTSIISFSDILKSIDERNKFYFDSGLYEIDASAFMSKDYSPDTQIDCSLDDEVIGAIFLGYKYIRFVVKKK